MANCAGAAVGGSLAEQEQEQELEQEQEQEQELEQEQEQLLGRMASPSSGRINVAGSRSWGGGVGEGEMDG